MSVDPEPVTGGGAQLAISLVYFGATAAPASAPTDPCIAIQRGIGCAFNPNFDCNSVPSNS
jgi:hypothetical protein